MNCQQSTERLESLQQLREQLGKAILASKESQTSGDTAKAEELKQQARNLKIKLETGIKEMNKEIFTFVVQNAVNPYKEGLAEAGLSIKHPECAEKKEIILDIEEVIEEHIQHYREQNMPEWADDIEENKELLFDIICDPEEQEKIRERINAGMIPIIMPGRDTQERTKRKPFKNLKPIWIENGEVQRLNPTNIHKVDTEKVPQFPDTLPHRPYMVWIKPTKVVEMVESSLAYEQENFDLTNFERYQKLLKQSHADNPSLVDLDDILPTEYAALQSFLTTKIKKLIIRHNPENAIKEIRPLDYFDENQDYSFTIFLSAYHSSDSYALGALFDPDEGRISFQKSNITYDRMHGFRPVARS